MNGWMQGWIGQPKKTETQKYTITTQTETITIQSFELNRFLQMLWHMKTNAKRNKNQKKVDRNEGK